MIECISIEEAIALLQPSEVEGSFVEKYIPSKDVRAKIESDMTRWLLSFLTRINRALFMLQIHMSIWERIV